MPWHSHGDRPAIIYIVSGEVKEFASNCSVAIVHKAMALDPAHRYQTCADFAADLRSYLAGKAVAARRLSIRR